MQLAILPSGSRPTPTFDVGGGRFREQGRTIVPPHRSVALEHDNRTQDPRISPLSTHTRPRTPSQHITTPRRTGNSSRFGPSSHILGGGPVDEQALGFEAPGFRRGERVGPSQPLQV